MKDSILVADAQIVQDGSKIYAVDMYSNNIYSINLKSNRIEIIGEISDEEENIYTVFVLHVCKDKLIMQPRNGKYIHVFDLEEKRDSIYDIGESVRDVDDIYNSFSLCYEENLYMFHRKSGLALKCDYYENNIQKIEISKSYEKMEITDFSIIEDTMYMHCRFLNKIIVYSVINEEIKEIPLPDELKGELINVHKIDEYIVAYHDKNRKVFLFDNKGMLLKKYDVPFKKSQINPFVYRLGNMVILLGNSGGEVYQVDIENECVEAKAINELSNIDIACIGEYSDYLCCLQMNKLNEKKLDYCIRIDKRNLEIAMNELELEASSTEAAIKWKYNQNISRQILEKNVCEERNKYYLKNLLCHENRIDTSNNNALHEYGALINEKIIMDLGR